MVDRETACSEQLIFSAALEDLVSDLKWQEDLKPLPSVNRTNSVNKSSESTGPMYQSTTISEPSRQMDLEKLTLSVEDSPANPGALLEKEKAMRIRSTVTSGRKWLRLLKIYGLNGSVAKMSEALLTNRWASPGHSLTWIPLDITQHIGFYLRLGSERDTEETESGLLHTPTATANQMAPSMRSRDKGSWWPTPTARDWKGGRHPETLAASGRGETNNLNDAVTVRDTHGQLNPMWVEWLMGYPEGWTDLEPSETPSSRK